jgi:hypothetical protein
VSDLQSALQLQRKCGHRPANAARVLNTPSANLLLNACQVLNERNTGRLRNAGRMLTGASADQLVHLAELKAAKRRQDRLLRHRPNKSRIDELIISPGEIRG